MQTRPIRFIHRGQPVQVQGPAPTRTVLEWLREDARCTGTKEGCAEGDCGACTVMVGELDAAGALRLATVNACIRLLPTLDGKALITVEDLAAGGQPHPAQQAMVRCHGSQCGFCTPGFVVSLAHAHEAHRAAGTRPTRQQLADALSGNLCRCTGYRPILDAGERMFDLHDGSPTRIDLCATVSALRALRAEQGDASFHYHAPNPAVPTPQGARLDTFHAPRTLEALAGLRLAHPKATLLAGGTDIGLWVTKRHRDLGEIIHVGDVAELRRIDRHGHTLHIGAAASLQAAWQALADAVPAFAEMGLRFASPPVRHAGTLGGNIANGSPIGDGAPVLMALQARLRLRRGASVRHLPLENFYLGYMKNDLREGEFLEAIEVPLPDAATQLRAYKISKRYDSDISALSLGAALRLDGDQVAEVRLAYGGLAAVVKRAAAAEAALLGQPWAELALQAATSALAQDFQPMTDMRASAAYRLKVAGNLLRRLWLETRADAPLPADAVNVWPQRSMA